MSDNTEQNYNPTLTDAILLLETYYSNGVTHRREAEIELRKYRRGTYRPKTTVIAPDQPKQSMPMLNYRYRQWTKSVEQTLSLKVIPKTTQAQFEDSEPTVDLDLDLATANSKLTNTAFKNSLRTLQGIIRELKTSQKTVSLKLVGSSLYLHIEPDDIDELVHDLMQDSPLGMLFNYLYSHQGELVERGHILLDSRGYAKDRNLSEDLRAIGITRQLKKLFFPVSKAAQIKFVNKAVISSEELDTILAELKSDSTKAT